MPDRRALIGRSYESTGLRVDADASSAYAEAIGDDPADHLRHGTASPFYAVRLVAPLWRTIYQSPELNTRDQLVLHAEQRMRVHRELRVGDRLTGRVSVTDVVGFGFNDAAIVHSVLLDRDDRPVVSMDSTLAVRGSTGLPPAPRRAGPPERGPLATRLRRVFDAGAPARYADAADDHNPLHLDDDAAREAGHPSRIVHGMCTLATGVSALVAALRKRRRERLVDLHARFSRPVLPDSAVDFVAHTSPVAHTYVVGASLDGRPVLKNCWLRLSGED
ncbi:MaoC/PaaZ C-terminal domain-containing protein [Streptomyces sp. 4N509B]|uniref:MaoC/PaaZ C-terminal domain-containing protein n=1 Tax=Streptomyces sp. 4N509B TaxID=3457413 RepID=UPI003FD31113